MNKIKKLLQLRKQNDSVKLTLVIFIVGIVACISAVNGGISIYNDYRKPVEYVLQPEKNKVTAQDIDELSHIQNVDFATAQTDGTLSIKTDNDTESISIAMVSDDYLKKVYSIHNREGMTCVYLTEKSFNKLKKKMEKTFQNKTANEYKAKVTIDMGQEQKQIIVKLVPLDNTKEQEGAFMAEPSAKLYGEEAKIRAYVTKSDVAGTTVLEIEEKGYAIENRDIVIENENDRKIAFNDIKYQLIIMALCALHMWSFSMTIKKRI